MSIKKPTLDRRVKRTKTALREALICLIQEKEFRDISITDIVQLADLNRGTFYKHYQYKEELLEEIVEDVITDLIHSYREPYQHVETFAIKELPSSAIKIFEHVHHHATFYTMIINSNVLPGFLFRISNELKKLSLHDLADCEPNLKINNELYASYQAYAILGMIIEWVHGGFKYSPGYMAEQLLEFMKNNPSNTIYKTKWRLD